MEVAVRGARSGRQGEQLLWRSRQCLRSHRRGGRRLQMKPEDLRPYAAECSPVRFMSESRRHDLNLDWSVYICTINIVRESGPLCQCSVQGGPADSCTVITGYMPPSRWHLHCMALNKHHSMRSQPRPPRIIGQTVIQGCVLLPHRSSSSWRMQRVKEIAVSSASTYAAHNVRCTYARSELHCVCMSRWLLLRLHISNG